MIFEWDETKAASNLRKHKISFEEASTVFADDLALSGRDPDHSIEEHRHITFGMSNKDRLLAVAHTDRGNKIRIISARLATRPERKMYEDS
jgi:hypothetical protein